MVYGAQLGAVQPRGIRRKKLRYAPLIQEQARQGLASNMVAAAKERKQYQEEKAFREAQARREQRQWEQEFEEQKRQNQMNTILGGASTAASIISLFT